MTTDKTIKSKYQPKQTNVTWIDLSGETPIEKHFINGGWVATSSGGSGGTTDYSSLKNKPSIDGVELNGDKTAAQLGLQSELTIDEDPTEGSTNPVQSGGVYEAMGSLYQALSVAENCLFGGFVTRLEAPSQGDDHRYYYITEQTGYFRYFDITLSDDSAATMIYWSDILSKWTIVGLWPTLAFVLKKANKVVDAVQGNLAGLDADGNLTDSGSKASDFATTSQGAKADTAYQKPSSGIPESDLSSDVQQALQKHFKGWYASSSALPANPVVGDYAYLKGASSTNPAAIYECTTDGTWNDSGRTVDTSNVQTFASGEEVNEVGIDAEPIAGSENLVKSGGVYTEVSQLRQEVDEMSVELHDAVELEFIPNKYINLSGGVGSVIPAPSDSQSFSYCKHAVIEGDIVIVNGTGGISPKLWAFVDDNDIILSVAGSSITGVNLQLVTPQNASYVIINTNDTSTPSYYKYHNSVASKLEENENSIISLNERVDNIDQDLHLSSQFPISIADTLQEKFISSTGNATDYSAYDILLYALTDISKVRISISGAANSLHLYGFYSSQIISSANLVGELGPTTSDGLYNQEVDIPSGAEYLAVTSYRGYQTTQIYSIVTTNLLQEIEQQISELDDSKQEKLTSGVNIKTIDGKSILGSGNISASAKNFNYLFVTGGIIIARPSGNRMMTIRLGTGGGNGLFDFREFGTLPLGAEIIKANIQRLHYSSSDWIAPFQIKAVNNIDGDDLDNITFTGGSHQYNNQITGSTPTARLESVEYRIDGEVKTEGSGSGNIIKIVTEEYIQGTNTKKADGTGREILKEIVTWSYDGDKWSMETELIPLEDIQMILWYGYQFTGIGSGLFEHWGYINGANRLIDESTSGNDKTIGVYAFGNCNLKMLLDTSTDMGNRAFMTSGVTNSAFKSGAKGYFFIANNNAILGIDNHYFLKGSYEFSLPTANVPVLSGSFHTSGASLNHSVQVSELEDGSYYVIWNASGNVTPSNINIYRTERNMSGLIQPIYENVLPGQQCNIEKTAATNYLWFYKNDLSADTDATISYGIFKTD